jgi:hypothetical protein
MPGIRQTRWVSGWMHWWQGSSSAGGSGGGGAGRSSGCAAFANVAAVGSWPGICGFAMHHLCPSTQHPLFWFVLPAVLVLPAPPLPPPLLPPFCCCALLLLLLQNAMVEVLHAVTSVRAVLVNGLSSGLRNDAPDRAIAMRQKCVEVGVGLAGCIGGFACRVRCACCAALCVDAANVILRPATGLASLPLTLFPCPFTWCVSHCVVQVAPMRSARRGLCIRRPLPLCQLTVQLRELY